MVKPARQHIHPKSRRQPLADCGDRHDGILRAPPEYVDVFSARNLSVVGTGTDLSARRLRYGDRAGVFLDSLCAGDLRVETARRRVRLGVLGICGFHHGLRRYPCESIYTLWVPIYGIEGITKALTALASIMTAAMLWPLL